MKIKGMSGKWLVKEIARRHLPENIVDRKKVGFKVPSGRVVPWRLQGLHA